jgi:plastocyanin domain-containing protein
VLPITTREKAFDRLKEIDDATLTNVTNFVSFKKLLEQNLKIDTSSQLEKFKKIIQMRDRYRKIKLANYIPELATDLGL